jgi:carboxyl-terminal processing protease
VAVTRHPPFATTLTVKATQRRASAHLAIASLVAIGLPPAKAQQPDLSTLEHRAEDFASFCRFVQDEYAYFDQKQTDWRRACTLYASQLAGATGRAAYIELLERTLGELYDHRAHLGTNTPKSYRRVPSPTDLFAAWTDGGATISDVRQNSGAERAGLLPGMEVLAIDGETIEAVLRSIEPKLLEKQIH